MIVITPAQAPGHVHLSPSRSPVHCASASQTFLPSWASSTDILAALLPARGNLPSVQQKRRRTVGGNARSPTVRVHLSVSSARCEIARCALQHCPLRTTQRWRQSRPNQLGLDVNPPRTSGSTSSGCPPRRPAQQKGAIPPSTLQFSARQSACSDGGHAVQPIEIVNVRRVSPYAS